MKRAPIVILAICIVCGGGAFVEWLNWQSGAKQIAELESYDHRDGKKEAEADIAHGVLKWKVAGRVSDYDVRASITKEKLGVELDWFGDCFARSDETATFTATIPRFAHTSLPCLVNRLFLVCWEVLQSARVKNEKG